MLQHTSREIVVSTNEKKVFYYKNGFVMKKFIYVLWRK